MKTETKQVTCASIYTLDGSELTTGLQTGAVCDEAIDTAYSMAEQRGEYVHLVDHDGEWLVGPAGECERYTESAAAGLTTGVIVPLMNGTNGGNWIEWTDYSDNSGIVALLRVGSERFSCSFTSAPKVIPVSNPGAQRSVSKRTMGIAKWAFEKELKLRATPEHLAAIVAFYAAPEVA